MTKIQAHDIDIWKKINGLIQHNQSTLIDFDLRIYW